MVFCQADCGMTSCVVFNIREKCLIHFTLFYFFQLLKEKGLLPELNLQVENIVCALDHNLQGAAATVATILRGKGQSVDLVLEIKPLKWYRAPSF